MVYDGWLDLVRVFVKGIIKGIIGYAAIILVLRVSGKRTLTKLNAFDFTVTVALGSTLASALLTKSVTVAEGSVAFIKLAALQFTVSWLSVRSSAFQRFIKSEPTLLLRDGRILDGAMRRQRVMHGELLAVLPNSGEPEIDGVAAVVLETDGSFSVMSGSLGCASA